MIITYDQFVKDYNEFYQCNARIVRVSTHDIFDVMYDLYNSDDFEINEDEETIEIF